MADAALLARQVARPVSGSDVGVIEYPGGPLYISVYTNANRGDFAQLEHTIGCIAELLVNRW